MQPTYKTCPMCSQPASLQDPICLRCGHQYRTPFPDQTQVFQVPPPPVPYQPPMPYQPPAYPYQQFPPPYQQPYYPPGAIWVAPGTHSPAVAVILSLFCFVGMGQIYNKQVGKGILFLVVSILAGICTLGLSVLVSFPLAAIDAGIIGGRLNRGEVIGPWQWF